MECENKITMVQLGNKRNESIESKKEFQNFVLNHISTFDIQAWDMFINLSDLIVDEMEDDIEYWKEIYKYVKNVDCNNEIFSFQGSMRIALIQTICEDDLKL